MRSAHSHLSTITLLSVVTLLSLGATGCSKSLKSLADGDGKLATDAKAVIAALKGSGIEPKAVAVAKSTDPSCDVTRSCAQVGVLDERIVGLCVNKAKAVDLTALKEATRLRRVWARESLTGKVAIKGGSSALELLLLQNNDDLEELEVEGLSGLRVLELTRSRVKRVSLSGLPKLRRLELPNQLLSLTMKRVGVISVHPSMEHLQQLELSELPNLNRFNLNGRLQKVALSNLPKLMQLNLASNRLEQVKLANLPVLPSVNLTSNQLKVVEFSRLPALTSVNLQHNKLKTLPSITGSPALKTLRLGNNKLTSLAGIEALSAKTLYVERNALRSLDPAAGTAPAAKAPKSQPPKGPVATAQVETLIASGNKLETLAGLAAYPNLTYLAVDDNKLRSLQGVERAPKLKTLRATNNKLKSVAGAEKLPKLRLLYLSFNELETLKPLAIAQLHTLYADHNKLSEPKEIFGETSKKRPKIERYDLRHNALKGVAAGLLVYGLARAGMHYGGRRRGWRYRTPNYRNRGGHRYRGSSPQIRSHGSRYSGGGGYRYGK